MANDGCDHDCSNCKLNCDSRKRQSPKKVNEKSKIKKVIGIISGKGGVGKSLVTALMAVSMRRKDYQVAIMDADITGPSIPKMFGLKRKAEGSEYGIFPVISSSGVKIMSINLLLESDTDPVVWRGPLLSGTVKQFWTDVIWDDVDFMFIDMPPGTGDIALTVFQSLPIDGIIIVTSPQELVSMIVGKAVKMAELMKVPVMGIVENMSYFECDKCGKRHDLFGKSNIEELASQYNIPQISKIPINPKLAAACDKGLIELYDGEWLDNIALAIEKMIEK